MDWWVGGGEREEEEEEEEEEEDVPRRPLWRVEEESEGRFWAIFMTRGMT